MISSCFHAVADEISTLTHICTSQYGLCLTKRRISAIDSVLEKLLSSIIHYRYSRTHRWRKLKMWLAHALSSGYGDIHSHAYLYLSVRSVPNCMCIVYAIDSLEVEKLFHLALIHHAPKYLYIASFLNRLQIHDIMTVSMDYHACGQYHVLDKGTILQNHDCKR